MKITWTTLNSIETLSYEQHPAPRKPHRVKAWGDAQRIKANSFNDTTGVIDSDPNATYIGKGSSFYESLEEANAAYEQEKVHYAIYLLEQAYDFLPEYLKENLNGLINEVKFYKRIT